MARVAAMIRTKREKLLPMRDSWEPIGAIDAVLMSTVESEFFSVMYATGK